MAEGISVWGSVSKAQGQELQEFVLSLVLWTTWIAPRLFQEICMTTSVEITIHHSSALLTTFLINLNAYLIPVHSVHALH